MAKTVVSKKGQVVIPKEARDKLGLTPGTVLKVQVDGKRVILEPLQEPPKEAFVEAEAVWHMEVSSRVVLEAFRQLRRVEFHFFRVKIKFRKVHALM